MPLDRLLVRASNRTYQSRQGRRTSLVEDREGLAVQNMREWYMVGRLGLALETLPDVRSVLWTVGAQHFDLVRKLRQFRVPAAAIHVAKIKDHAYVDQLYRTGIFPQARQ